MTRNIDLSASTLVATQLTENADDMVEEGKEMSSDDLIITGDYSDYDILEEEKDYISKNDFVWVKTKKEIWRGRVLLIPYSKNKEDREYLKIKWIDSRKEERILIKNVSLNYSKKRVPMPTQQYFNGACMEETVHNITTKTRQRKESMTWTNK